MCDEMSEGAYQSMMGEIDSLGRGEYWRTKDGRVVRVENMDDAHLMNTIRMLRRKCSQYQLAEIRFLSASSVNAGDMAADGIAMEALAIGDMSVDEYLAHRWPMFNVLLDEAKRRELEGK